MGPLTQDAEVVMIAARTRLCRADGGRREAQHPERLSRFPPAPVLTVSQRLSG
jgi:hypothetical protein